jgi:hypothetical protein
MVPDPPVQGQPFTVEVSGVMDETVATGAVKLDLNIGALGIIHSEAKLNIPFTANPTPFVKGPIKVNVGPVVLPKVPGTTTIKGQVHTADAKGEQLMCVDLDIKVGGASALPMDMLNASIPAFSAVQDITSCSKPTDHLKNFNLVVDKAKGSMTVTGNMDEELSTLKINLDMTLTKFFVHIPLKSSVPVQMSPALPKGDFKLAIGPVTGSLSPDPKATVAGQVVAADGKDEEVFCLNVNQVVEEIVV